jgi:hypothetical protein
MRQVAGLLGIVALWCSLSGGTALGAGITNSGNDLRDGWYGDQPALSPDLVGGSTFGKLFSADVDGQVYAQPLVHGGHVVVATERNQVVSLDSETGARAWGRTLPHGAPWNPRDLGCSDLLPDIGVTATPVVDEATNTIYLTHKTYASGGTSGPAQWWMDALDADTGLERPGFPVEIQGAAQNAPGVVFNPTLELQRPGLLLLDGVVYAAFGGHCDVGQSPGWSYQGWVFGVNTAGVIKARWSAVTTWGAGIWQSGSGLMSDGPGRIFVATGNGGSPPVGHAGSDAVGNYGESVIRLAVQPDGSLAARDFFAPYDAADLDEWDADFASGGVTALRDDVFGTPAFPHLAVAVGKSGYLYMLDRDHLGGIGMGATGADAVVSRVGPYGGVWARPAIWPGDGGWMMIPTATSDTGQSANGASGYLKMFQYSVVGGRPTMVARAQTTDAWGFSSGSAVITSDGLRSGSALGWAIHSTGGSGVGSELRAYDAVPINGKPNQRFAYPIGTASKFAMPGVGAGRVYVGTRDGKVLGFGSPVDPALQGTSTTFARTTVGESRTKDVTLRASGHLQITSVATTTPFFGATAALPKTLDAGESLTVSVTFHPPATGAAGGALRVVTSAGTFEFGLNGSGQASGPLLATAPPALSFGGTVAGESPLDGTATFANEGSEELEVLAVELPDAPFTVDGAPVAGQRIASDARIDLTVHFAPQVPDSYTDEITLHTTGGTRSIGLSGTAGAGGHLEIRPAAGVAFGPVLVGHTVVRELVLANSGDTAFRITKSKAPATEPFVALDPLDEGTTLQPGEQRALRIRFSPQAVGPASSAWTINGTDGSGLHLIALTGEGTVPPPPPPPPPPDPETGSGPGSGSGTDTGGSGTREGASATAGTGTAGAASGPGSDGGGSGAAGIVSGEGTPVFPPKVRPGLLLSRAQVARDGRRLTIVGLVNPLAAGSLGLTVTARTTAKRTATLVTGRTVRGGRFVVHVTLPRAARRWRSLKISARFAGNSRVWPGAATLVLVPAR